jgi:CDGSH iron-sulfur domain-containing protein 3
MEKKIVQKKPMIMEVEPGRYAWCSCGHSTKQPYCDGSHKGSGMSPIIEEVTETKTVAWCACKSSEKGAFCDGSHAKL